MQINLEGQNKLYKTVEDVNDIANQVRENSRSLVELNLTGNVFYPEAMEYLFEEVSKAQKIKKCIFVGILATLPKAIMLTNLKIMCNKLPTKKLELLDLSDNALSCELPDEFRNFFHSMERLMILKINNCGLGEKGGNWLADTLLGMKYKNTLEVIELAQNKFINFPLKLGVALEQFTSLEELRIHYNTIDQKSMDTFLKSFENHSLRILDIRDNALSTEGCRMLGSFFVYWDIEEIYLGSCLMSTEGLNVFLEKASEKLDRPCLHGSFIEYKRKFILDISNNEIEQAGIDALIKFFDNHHVDKLYIQGNEYDDCGELVKLIELKGGKVIHDYEDDKNLTETDLIRKFEEALGDAGL